MNRFFHELKTSPLYVHGVRLHLYGAAVLRCYSIYIQTWTASSAFYLIKAIA